jgi:tetratricopeptide (TPR) repeat protein
MDESSKNGSSYFQDKTKEQWVDKAIKLYNTTYYVDALAACGYAIRLDPSYARAYHGRGLIFTREGKYKAALGNFLKAIELAPETAKIYADMAEVYCILQNYEEAYVSYKRAIQLDGKYESIFQKRAKELVDRAFSWFKLERLGLAFTYFNQALLFCPDDAQVRSVLTEFELKGYTVSNPPPPPTPIPNISRVSFSNHNDFYIPNVSNVHTAYCTCPTCVNYE